MKIENMKEKLSYGSLPEMKVTLKQLSGTGVIN